MIRTDSKIILIGNTVDLTKFLNGNLMDPIIVLNEHLLNSSTAASSNDHSTM